MTITPNPDNSKSMGSYTDASSGSAHVGADSPASAAPGWYRTSPDVESWWNGSAWTGQARAIQSNDKTKARLVVAGAIILAVIGLIMAMQSVSLLTGSSTVWTGVALVAGAAVLAFVMSGPTWLKVLTLLLLVLVVANGVYIESQLDQKRQEISEFFNR